MGWSLDACAEMVLFISFTMVSVDSNQSEHTQKEHKNRERKKSNDTEEERKRVQMHTNGAGNPLL